MSLLSLRPALAVVALLAFAARAYPQAGNAALTPAPATPTPVTPAVASAPPAVEAQDTADAKLAVVLRSYTLLSGENDQLRAAQEKLIAEKAALAGELAAAKSSDETLRNDLTSASSTASQAGALREQLRQTQDQLAALALENNQLKTRLALGAPTPGGVMAAPTHPSEVATPTAPVAPAPAAPAVRMHVIAAGDTLSKISRQYYGTPDRWTEILAANRDALHDEKSLIVGHTLRIP